MEEQLVSTKKWYTKWWGILIVGFLIFLAGVLVYFVYLYISITNNLYNGRFDSRLVNNQYAAPFDMAEIVDPTDPSLGTDGAPITIVEFGDFLCPVCGKSFPVMRELVAKHPDKIKYYWRNLPIISQESGNLAHAGECAHQQEKFWPFHDRLFQLQGQVNSGTVDAIARQIGLNETLFEKCLDNKNVLYKLQDDLDIAAGVEATGTPTFLVNGHKISGFVPMEVWEQIIDKIAE